MKKGTLFLALALTGFFIASSHRLSAATITATLATSGAYKFDIIGLPVLADPDAYYKVLLCTGDGHFFLCDKGNPTTKANDIDNYQHFYETSYTGLVLWAEVTPVYDDGENPSVSYISTTIGSVNAGSGNSNLLRSFSGNLEVICAQKIVPGCRVTYVVTVSNTNTGGSNGTSPCVWNGTVDLTYDKNILEPVTGSNTGTLTLSVNNLQPGKQQSVFFHMTTKPGTLGQTLTPSTSVYLANTGNCRLTGEVTMPSQTVEIAHDPNRKFPSLSIVSQTDTEIEYEITFQNDGKSKANRIVIHDELDIDLYDMIVSNSSKGEINSVNFTGLTGPTPLGNRTYEWVFSASNLNGTNQTGYGSIFFDPATKGSLRFKVKVQNVTPCGAILNRATIYFDCNAPMVTDLAVTPIGCSSPTPFPAIDSCASFVNKIWHAQASNQGLAPGSPIANLLDPGLANLYAGSTAKWYPSYRLGNPRSLQTGVSMARSEEYALVVSPASSCKRYIFLLPVQTTAGAQDEAMLIEDVPGNCQADLIVTGGAAPYTYHWMYNSGTVLNGPSRLDLGGKTNVSVTVTDSNNCTATFSPAAVSCSWWPW